MRRIYLLLFFLTGFSALIYEIAWVRQATLTFGVSIYAYSAVLTAYMTGLALGSLWIGRRADAAEKPLRLFGILQVALALLGALTPLALSGLSALYASVARSMEPGLFSLVLLRLVLALLVLVPPSICIGALFPVMSRLYARRDGAVGSDVGWMYAVNTLGSVLGCLAAAVILIRVLGVQGTVIFAALVNLATAGLALLRERGPAARTEARPNASRGKHASGRGRRREMEHMRQPLRADSEQPSPLVLRFVFWAYAVSGFCALAYEVVWARILALFTVGAVYSFSIMLSVFLTGLVVGGLLGSWWVKRRRASLLHFGAVELGIGLMAVLALFAFNGLPRLTIEDLFGAYNIPAEMAFEGLLSFLTLFPVTMLIGAAFPLAASLYTGERAAEIGRRMARLSAVNTAGSILGSLLTGFVILPALGIRGSVFLLAGLNLLVGAAAVWISAPRGWAARLAPVGAAVAAVLAALVVPNTRYLGYWQNIADQVVFYREGTETTVAVFAPGSDNPKFSTVNGRIEVPTDVLSMRAFYLLGHLPPLLNPGAENVLMLSFGNGIASGALATHNVPSLEVVELAPEMVEAARQVYTVENRAVTDYPGLKIHLEDARNFLLQTGRKFDIITTDATHPSNSSSWTLFTQEFYQQVRDHLAEDGVFLQWVPIHNLAIEDYKRILRTYQSVFPNATLWYTGGSHTLLLATPEPLTMDLLLDRLAAAPANEAVMQDLGDPQRIARHWIMNAEQLRAFTGPGSVARDNSAFFLPENAEMKELTQIIQQAAVQANP